MQGQQGSGMGTGQQDKDRSQGGQDQSQDTGSSQGSIGQGGYAGDQTSGYQGGQSGDAGYGGGQSGTGSDTGSETRPVTDSGSGYAGAGTDTGYDTGTGSSSVTGTGDPGNDLDPDRSGDTPRRTDDLGLPGGRSGRARRGRPSRAPEPPRHLADRSPDGGRSVHVPRRQRVSASARRRSMSPSRWSRTRGQSSHTRVVDGVPDAAAPRSALAPEHAFLGGADRQERRLGPPVQRVRLEFDPVRAQIVERVGHERSFASALRPRPRKPRPSHV